jgi:hypothetical protein
MPAQQYLFLLAIPSITGEPLLPDVISHYHCISVQFNMN